jgi:hypothetical protein
MIKRISKLATVTILIGVCTVGAMSIAASEASSSSAILEFGSNGKRNMLYDARQRPQSVLLHGRLYIVYNGDASATKNGKGNAYPMFISYDPQSRKFSKSVRIGLRVPIIITAQLYGPMNRITCMCCMDAIEHRVSILSQANLLPRE